MRQVLTDRIFKSSLDCMYKCHLLLNGKHGSKTEYEKHTAHFDAMYQRAAIDSFQGTNPDRLTVYIDGLTPLALHNDAQFVIIKRVEVNGLRSDSIVMAHAEDRRGSLQPVLFHRSDEINVRAKLLLAFRAVLIEKITGVALSHGQIIYGQVFSRLLIPLSAFIAKVDSMIRRIDELVIQQKPALFLCPHCEICEFETRCQSRAVVEDNMSLIHGITRPHIEEQNKKGIFTLHQYSHTFRSRRLPKRAKNPSKPRYFAFALQARALRDNKVYIHGNPTLPASKTSIYFDIEGIPSRRSYYYLLGTLVVTESGEFYRAFWVDDGSAQPGAFVNFCEVVAAYSNASLFHYGAYETKALKEMREYVGGRYVSLVDRILDSCHNLLSVVHHHCYFQTYSNRLKDIAGFLGYQFDNEVRSGIGSIIFRERWEETASHTLKEALITYNRQDCEALKTVCEFVRRSAASAAARENIPGQEAEVVSTESLRKIGEGNRPVFRKAQFLYPEFELANKCAYFDYQRDRVFARTRRLSVRSRSGPKTTQRRLSLATDILGVPDRCPACGSKRLRLVKRSVRWQIDLKFYKTKIGVKKWQPRYVVSHLQCLKCCGTFTLPTVPFVADSRLRYGHGLMCWCVYQSIVGRQSMLSVHRGLMDIFDLHIDPSRLYGFKAILASYYKELSKEILAAVLSANVIHIDETSVKLRKSVGYIWVICSASDVCYLFRDSREGSFLKDLLGTYEGTLVSDFFTAYDSVKSRQQKCLVHLMRDLNDDLRRNPYDQEMRSIAEPFAKLLKDIILAIDQYGLRRRHLHEFAKPAEKMCMAIAERHFASGCALKYQSRFEKYGDRLFTFLNYDEVPWNNNNAEHAVHRFAKLRQISDGTFTRSSIEQLLVLLSVLGTCEYRRVNPLKFLLSGRREFRALEN
jgi:predicted RecB family nuclease